VTTYIVRRVLSSIAAIAVTSVVLFVVIRVLPGDPILVLVGQTQTQITPEAFTRLQHEWDLDKPLHVQYLTWAGKFLVGDFGRSIRTRQPVITILAPCIPPTLQIGLMAFLIALSFAIPLGVISATSPNSWKDWLGTTCALIGAAAPYFLLGGLLIYVVALRLHWLPPSGYVSPFVDPLQSAKLCLMPAVTIALGLAAITTRQTRSSLIEVLQQPYVTTARSKGLTEAAIILRHAFKNALLPVVTILGLYLSSLFGGAVITETIFAVPGIGRLLVDGILSRDYPIVQAVVLLISSVVAMANLTVDLAYGLLDPRIRLR
jgi:peptide/nickel transport system permease protein